MKLYDYGLNEVTRVREADFALVEEDDETQRMYADGNTDGLGVEGKGWYIWDDNYNTWWTYEGVESIIDRYVDRIKRMHELVARRERER